MNSKVKAGMAKTKKIKLALVGASGRMGEAVIKSMDESFELAWAQSESNSFDGLASARADVIIDFSQPQATLNWSKLFVGKKMPKALICTTGFSLAQKKLLEKQLSGQTYALVPNTSLGVFGMKKALELLSSIFDDRYQFHLTESHHVHKKDAPSGTALLLRDAVDKTRKSSQTPINSIRAGTDPGTHTVEIFGPHEKITITHSAESRQLFAEGALFLAKKLLASKKRGALNGVDDLMK